MRGEAGRGEGKQGVARRGGVGWGGARLGYTEQGELWQDKRGGARGSEVERGEAR